MATSEPSLKREPKDCAAQLAAIAGQAVRMTVANGAAIAVRQNDQVVTVASFGDSVPELGAAIRPTSFAGRCIVEEKLLVCHDTETDPSVDAAACRALKVRSMIAAPVLGGEQVIGVLAVFANWPNAFVENRVSLIRTLAGIAGELIALDRSQQAEAQEVQAVAAAEQEPAVAEAPPVTEAAAAPAPPTTVASSPETSAPVLDPANIAPDHEPAGEPVLSAGPEPKTNADVAPLQPGETVNHPLASLSPSELSSQLRMGTSKDDLMLFPGFSIEEEKPRSRLALKVTIVLLVVAALAAGQWFWRGKIIDAVHKYVTPYIRIVHPSQAEPNAAPVTTAPKPVAPAPAAPAAAEPAPQQTEPAPAVQDKASPGNGAAPPASKPAAPPKATKAPPSNGPAELRPPHLLHRVEPVSPPDLKAESTVVLNATVLKDGSIGKVTVVNGAPALHPAAIATVRQWQYRPAYQNGQPVPATVDVELTFKASH